MKNYVIINGVNSNTITGLMINELPPISKPSMRVETEEIDGRDGDISTNLGYSAYDKTITIGLFGTGYDIDNVIAFFNGEGNIVFSNESDKFYYFKIINKIDYERLQKFKTATVTFHCQPFKYPLTETPEEIEYEYVEGEGETITLNNTADGKALELTLKGNTSQVSYTGRNLIGYNNSLPYTNFDLTLARENDNYKTTGTASGWFYKKIFEIPANSLNGTYLVKKIAISGTSTAKIRIIDRTVSPAVTYAETDAQATFTISNNNTLVVEITVANGASSNETFNILMQLSSITDNAYEPYVGGTASPNPSYPQEVEVVTGNNTIIEFGNNHFNKETIIDNKGILYASGTLNSDNNQWASDYIEITPNTNYYCNYKTYTSSYYGMAFYDENKTYISGNSLSNIGNGFTTPNNSKYLRFSCSKQSGYTTDPNTLQLKIGSTATPYDPYTSTSYSVNLGVENFIDYSSLSNQQYITTEGDYITITNNSGATIYPTITFSTPLAIGNYTSRVEVVSITSGKTFFIYSQENNSDYTAEHTVSFNTATTKVVTQTFTDTFKKYMMVVPDGCTVKLSAMVVKGTYSSEQLGSFTPYGTTPIELCKIPNTEYQDYFYKDEETWYKHSMVKKKIFNGTENWDLVSINSYNIANFALSGGLSDYVGGSNNLALSDHFSAQTTLGANTQTAGFFLNQYKELYLRIESSKASTSADLKTWFSSNNTSFYYATGVETDEEVTGATLISQLDDIEEATSFDKQTNIIQVNYIKPFIIGAVAMKDGSDSVIVNNIGNTYARPTLDLIGTGIVNIYLNGNQVFQVDLSEHNEIIIDTNKMEAYDTSNNLMNRFVTGNYNSFKLQSGNNSIKVDGLLTSATITNYVRWL